MASISESTAEYSVLFFTSQRRPSAFARLAVTTSRSFSLVRRSLRVVSAFSLTASRDFLASASAAFIASICLGRRAASASSAASRVSKPCKSIKVRSWASTPSLIVAEAEQQWAHLDSNQDLTGYEPAALPLSYGPAGSSCPTLGPGYDYRKLRSFLERDGWRSLRSALASICRMRSRVTAKSWPTSSSVCSQPSERPKRSRRTCSSRGESVLRHLFVCSRSESPMMESTGDTTCLSSLISPR